MAQHVKIGEKQQITVIKAKIKSKFNRISKLLMRRASTGRGSCWTCRFVRSKVRSEVRRRANKSQPRPNKSPQIATKTQQTATNRNQEMTKRSRGAYQRYDRQETHDEDQRILPFSVECEVEGPSFKLKRIQCKMLGVGCRTATSSKIEQ